MKPLCSRLSSRPERSFAEAFGLECPRHRRCILGRLCSETGSVPRGTPLFTPPSLFYICSTSDRKIDLDNVSRLGGRQGFVLNAVTNVENQRLRKASADLNPRQADPMGGVTGKLVSSAPACLCRAHHADAERLQASRLPRSVSIARRSVRCRGTGRCRSARSQSDVAQFRDSQHEKPRLRYHRLTRCSAAPLDTRRRGELPSDGDPCQRDDINAVVGALGHRGEGQRRGPRNRDRPLRCRRSLGWGRHRPSSTSSQPAATQSQLK